MSRVSLSEWCRIYDILWEYVNNSVRKEGRLAYYFDNKIGISGLGSTTGILRNKIRNVWDMNSDFELSIFQLVKMKGAFGQRIIISETENFFIRQNKPIFEFFIEMLDTNIDISVARLY